VFGEIIPSRWVRAIEENAASMGLPLSHMMECAGKCVADLAAELVGKGRIVIVAGRGGNAGDAFVAARHLSCRGFDVTVLLLYPENEITNPDARRNLELLKRTRARILLVKTVEGLDSVLGDADVVIDGVLGTGVRPPLRSPVKEAVEAINRARGVKIAIDVPSGLDPDKGVVAEPVVKADYTVAMHYLKPGYKRAEHVVGKVVLCNIGMPEDAERIVGPGNLKYFVKRRGREAKKGDGGRVLVIGGSRDYTGAPALAAMAALASGADIATVLCPSSVRGIIASYSPSLITIGVEGDYLGPEHVDNAVRASRKAGSVVLGPGLSYNESTREFSLNLTRKLVSLGVPLVIDADALKALGDSSLRLGWKAVVTPHRGEFKLLLEKRGVNIEGSMIEQVSALSRELEAVVLLKGPEDYICQDDKCYVNKTGTPGMSVGGSGDVLAGILGELINRTQSLLEAAMVAAYVNGRAGELAWKDKGEFITPIDLLERVPVIMRSVNE